MSYKKFDDWFFEGEEFGLRAERFYESLGAFKSNAGKEQNIVLWLMAAFEAGKQSNEKSS